MTIADVYTAAFQGIEAHEVDVQAHIGDAAKPDTAGAKLLSQAAERLKQSAHGYHRVLKIVRTIADLAGNDAVAKPHIAEAPPYRRLTHLP